MPLTALLLTLAAAALHAGWNVLLGTARDPEAATAVAFLGGALAFLPIAILTWDAAAAAAPYIAGSCALELAYLAFLGRAYATGSVAVVYPVARGSAPEVVTGIPAIVYAAWIAHRRGVHSVLRAARSARRRGGVAIPRAAWIARRSGFGALRAEIKPRTVAAGCAAFAAYGFVLLALERAQAAPVAAVRESSVVLVLLIAAAMGRERLTARRLAGALAMVLGIAVLALP